MDSHFLSRRIHSLTGLVPVGLFLVYHLYLQLYLHSGAEVYNGVINGFYDSPLAIWSLVIVVYIPLFFHAFFGIRLIFESNVQPSYTYFSHLLYWLQRISGIGVLLFIIAHIWNTQLGPWFAGNWGTHFEHLSRITRNFLITVRRSERSERFCAVRLMVCLTRLSADL